MGILSKIKSLLPVSSRSFHRVLEDLHGKVDMLESKLNLINGQIDESHERMDHMLARIDDDVIPAVNATEQQIKCHDSHMKLMQWEQVRNEGESLDDAKKRFFLSLPKATGPLRLLQLGCAQLLCEFDALCSEHRIPYWIAFGTLLGAVRHKGFIPWDDDTDLGMMRGDIEALMQIVEEDERFTVTSLYDRCVHCNQVRFKYSDPNIPCFLDLFIFDYVKEPSTALFEAQQAERDRMVKSMEADAQLDAWVYGEGCDSKSKLGQHIGSHFERGRNAVRSMGIGVEEEQADGMVWAIENLNDLNGYQWICDLDDVFPLVRIEFEGIMCNAPHHFEKFIYEVYHDPYSLPADLTTHFDHVPQDELRSNVVVQSMTKLIGSEGAAS